MSSQSFAQLQYDPNYYDVEVATSVGPMKHVLDATKHENQQRCAGFAPEMNTNSTVSEPTQKAENIGRFSHVVDDESDLRRLYYKLSKDPAARYMPSNKAKESVNYADCSLAIRTEVSRLNYNINDFKAPNVERFHYDDPMRNFMAPLYRQGYVETNTYNRGNGASSRLIAKDDYVSMHNFTSSG